jgi:hypothetical protein
MGVALVGLVQEHSVLTGFDSVVAVMVILLLGRFITKKTASFQKPFTLETSQGLEYEMLTLIEFGIRGKQTFC